MKSFIPETHLSTFVLTSFYEEKHFGMVATWVSPASLRTDEIRFTVALSKFNDSTSAILKSKFFILHKFPKHEFKTVFRMGLYHSQTYDKFGQELYEVNPRGIRILKNSSSFGEAQVLSVMETEDRYIAYCKVDKIINKGSEDEVLTLDTLFKQLTPEESELLHEKHLKSIAQDTSSSKT